MRIASARCSLGLRAILVAIQTAGYFHIFKGVQASGPETIYNAGDLLATFVLPNPSYVEGGGIATFADLTGTILRTGIATWGRFADGADVGVIDVKIGQTPVAGSLPLPGDPVYDMLFLDTSFSLNGPASMAGYTIRLPGGF